MKGTGRKGLEGRGERKGLEGRAWKEVPGRKGRE